MDRPIQFEHSEIPRIAAVLRDLALYRGPSEPTRCTCKRRDYSGVHQHECPRGAELRLLRAELADRAVK